MASIQVSRAAYPYVIATLNLFFALIFAVVSVIGFAALSDFPKPFFLAPVVALAAAANGVRVWRTYGLTTGLMTLLLGIGLAILGLGALALRALIHM